MCLDSVTRQLEAVTLIESGWKNFSGTLDKPQFENYPLWGDRNVPLDRWLTAERTVIAPIKYDAGFHIYTDETEHRNRSKTLRRVYFRKAHTRGVQGAKTVAIAGEMYVPSDPDGWPPRS